MAKKPRVKIRIWIIILIFMNLNNIHEFCDHEDLPLLSLVSYSSNSLLN